MEINSRVLKELEILNGDGNNSIFKLLDKTKTDGGRLILKRFFKVPKNNIGDILAVQDTVRYIQKNLYNWKIKITSENVKVIENYCNSNIVPVFFRSRVIITFEGYLYKLNYPEFYREIFQGLAKTLEYLNWLSDFYQTNNTENLPELLKEQFRELTEIFSNNTIQRLRGLSAYSFSLNDIFYYDKLTREELTGEIIKLIDITFRLDAFVSMAEAANEHKLVFPEFVNDEGKLFISTTGLYHLFVKKPVKNNTALNHEKNFIFLTGPNMAGKTTYLKSLAVAVFLAHIGMPVPAETFQLSLIDTILTSISTTDNLSEGYSFFYSEVKRVKDAALELKTGKKLLVIFDELFKGTNVEDAYECSRMVIEGFAQQKNALFILSSHLVELEKELLKQKNIGFYYFDAEIIENKPVYNFTLKKGVSAQRFGRLILENEKIMEILSDNKKTIVK